MNESNQRRRAEERKERTSTVQECCNSIQVVVLARYATQRKNYPRYSTREQQQSRRPTTDHQRPTPCDENSDLTFNAKNKYFEVVDLLL